MPADDDAPNTAGWDALDAACDALYPETKPQHWGTLLRWSLGGDDPLDGVSAYAADNPPHWHFVTYGMSELYEKESKSKDYSGWGFEFTFRLARKANAKKVPLWAVAFLQNLGRYVCESGNPFGVNHHIDCNGPIAAESKSLLNAVAFVEDPQLGTIDTPNGKVAFLQVVGLTADELAAMMEWNTAGFLKIMAETNPRLVTELKRKSILKDDATYMRVSDATAGEGSSLGGLHLDLLSWKPTTTRFTLTLRGGAIERIVRLLRGRLTFGHGFLLDGPEQSAEFLPGKKSSVTATKTKLKIRLGASDADDWLSCLQPEPGTYKIPSMPNLAIVVKRAKGAG